VTIREMLKFEAPEERRYPILLNSRESVRVQPGRLDIMRSVAYPYSCAYARTECGRMRRGTSPTLLAQEINVLKLGKASRLLPYCACGIFGKDLPAARGRCFGRCVK
jgi:hypothetical protein